SGILIPGDLTTTINIVNLSDNSDPGFFVGSTLLLDPPLLEMAWGVSYGLLFDASMSYFEPGNGFQIFWSLPSGFSGDDLMFKIIHINDVNPLSTDLDQISKIELYTDNLNIGWNDYNTISFNLVGSDYTYTNEATMLTPETWIVILARTPDGKEFIYARAQLPGV
ncbi:MAG: hypothetical protein PF518_19540, partial [Spirochaetaceae bacterium]|nr:hypothetical protein [Spirochaetaceae bacterium]